MSAIRFLISLFVILSAGNPYSLAAEQKTDNSAKKVATQNIGGLLFEVDEGVKVEQGPGGSVYMKSNKEFMQEKFSQIEQKFADLESRIVKLEAKSAASSPLPSASPSSSAESENRRVLIT